MAARQWSSVDDKSSACVAVVSKRRLSVSQWAMNEESIDFWHPLLRLQRVAIDSSSSAGVIVHRHAVFDWWLTTSNSSSALTCKRFAGDRSRWSLQCKNAWSQTQKYETPMPVCCHDGLNLVQGRETQAVEISKSSRTLYRICTLSCWRVHITNIVFSL